jgi:hypothetical protein
MRLTIIPMDGVVILDEKVYRNLDLSFMDNTIHAVQWYGTYGEVEHKDPITGKMTANREIQSIEEFQQAIAVWQAAKDAEEARLEAARLAAETPVSDAHNVIV